MGVSIEGATWAISLGSLVVQTPREYWSDPLENFLSISCLRVKGQAGSMFGDEWERTLEWRVPPFEIQKCKLHDSHVFVPSGICILMLACPPQSTNPLSLPWSVVKLCLTLSNPVDCSPPGSFNFSRLITLNKANCYITRWKYFGGGIGGGSLKTHEIKTALLLLPFLLIPSRNSRPSS